MQLDTSLNFSHAQVQNNVFLILNRGKSFDEKVNWNFSGYGKLWTYHLNYFDYIHTSRHSADMLPLMNDFAANYQFVVDGKEPYPTSIRLINWIKYLSKHKIENDRLNRVLYCDYKRLQNNLEYHILGNHLLENGFALLWASQYFQDRKVFEKAQRILIKELNEQILPDGAHFELSPMYHKIILFRILNCITLFQNNTSFESLELQDLLTRKANAMLGWLINMTYENGETPQVNDSTPGISPDTADLIHFAKSLNIVADVRQLKESGYRMYKRSKFELFIDAGDIGPDYIPGHAHSDSLAFELNYKGCPILVDAGISTYEPNSIRQYERSTAAHNTVMVENKEQSKMWSAFRVAKRAYTQIVEEKKDYLRAYHDGYRALGVKHFRAFRCLDGEVVIADEISRSCDAKAFLHFHPDVMVRLDGTRIVGSFGEICFEGESRIEPSDYFHSYGFNRTRKAQMFTIHFNQFLNTMITIL